MKIGIIAADEDTINCFRLAGFEHSYYVKNIEEAQDYIYRLLRLKEFAIVILTDSIADKMRDVISQITEEHDYPIIVTIPNFGGPYKLSFDLVVELIKRKTGVELKI